MDERADGAGSVQTLLDVEVRGGLVEHENVPVLDAHHCAREALQLPAGQRRDLAVSDVRQIYMSKKS